MHHDSRQVASHQHGQISAEVIVGNVELRQVGC
jgi:hypothetical protein